MRGVRGYLTRNVSAKAATDISRVIMAAMNPAKANFFTGFTSPCYCATREAQLIFSSHLVHCDGNNHALFPQAILRYPAPPCTALPDVTGLRPSAAVGG